MWWWRRPCWGGVRRAWAGWKQRWRGRHHMELGWAGWKGGELGWAGLARRVLGFGVSGLGFGVWARRGSARACGATSFSSAILITSSASPGRCGTSGGVVKSFRSLRAADVFVHELRPAQHRGQPARQPLRQPRGETRLAAARWSVEQEPLDPLRSQLVEQRPRRGERRPYPPSDLLQRGAQPSDSAVTANHCAGSSERYAAAASAASSRSSNHFPP